MRPRVPRVTEGRLSERIASIQTCVRSKRDGFIVDQEEASSFILHIGEFFRKAQGIARRCFAIV